MKAKGISDEDMGEVKDRKPLPGTPSSAELVKHVLGHQAVLRRLKEKVKKENKE